MKKEFLFPPEVKFPKNLAPSKLSHAVKTSGARDTIHVSGQVSSDEHGEIVGVGDLEAQIHQVYKNLEKVLISAGGTLQDVVLLMPPICMVKILSDFGYWTLASAECTQTSCQISKKKNRGISKDFINKIIFTNIR